MKRNELKVRRNFHVSKRITNRLERQYGISLDVPYARDTVPATIASSRQQLRKTPEKTSPPVANKGIEPRGETFQSRHRFLSAFACLSDDDATEWAHDDYLALQLGPISTGTQIKTSRHTRHPDCDEPECGSSNWLCDLCQEVSADEDCGYQPVPCPSAPLDERHGSKDVDLPSERSLPIAQFIKICPLANAIRQIRERKVLPDIEDHYDSTIFDIEEDPAPPLIDVVLPSIPHREQSTVPSQKESRQGISETMLILAYLLSTRDVIPPSHLPGVDTYNEVLSITREQGFVFDRGKSCSCGLWNTRVPIAIA